METTQETESLPWFSISLRVILGGIFIWAGIVKLLDLPSFIESIGHFEISPFDQSPWDMWLGYCLPSFEIITGSCLILGYLYRGAAISTLILSLSFLIAIYSVHTRGLNIECGCFGKALSFDNYHTHLAVLLAMTIAAAILIYLEITSKSNKNMA